MCFPAYLLHTFGAQKWLIFNSNFTIEEHFSHQAVKKYHLSTLYPGKPKCFILVKLSYFSSLVITTLINRIHFILIRQPGYNSYMPSLKQKNDIYLPITRPTQSQTTIFSPLVPVAMCLVFSLFPCVSASLHLSLPLSPFLLR